MKPRCPRCNGLGIRDIDEDIRCVNCGRAILEAPPELAWYAEETQSDADYHIYMHEQQHARYSSYGNPDGYTGLVL